MFTSNKLNNEGIAPILIIAVVVVLAGIGFAGYRVYKNSQDKEVVTTPQVSNSDTKPEEKEDQPKDVSYKQTEPNQDTPGYLTIKEYKVRIPLDDRTAGLKLGETAVSGYNQNDKSIPIIAPELDGSWKCEVDPIDNSKGQIGSISITTQAKRSGPNEPMVAKKIGDYTYGFEPGGSNCTDSLAYQELVDAFKIRFEQLESF